MRIRKCTWIETSINCIFAILIYLIAVIAFSEMVSTTFLAALLLLPLLFMVCYGIRKKKISIAVRHTRLIWWIIFGCASLLTIVIAYHVRVELTWDYGKCIKEASKYVINGTVDDVAYFARYPNNQFWFFCLAIFFQFVKLFCPRAGEPEFYMASIALGCLFVIVAIALFYKIVYICQGEKRALAAGCICLLCLPLYLYATFAYTDTSGMLLCMLLIYFYLKLKHAASIGTSIGFMILLGVTAAVTYKLKVTVYIVFIAIIVTLMLHFRSWKKNLMLVLVAGITLGGSLQLVSESVKTVVAVDEKTADMYEFPLTHWIMMSLDYGGYRQEDVDYTISIPTYEQRKEKTIEKAFERLEDKGVLGSIKFFLYDKIKRTWSDSTFASSDYLSRQPVHQDGILEAFVSKEGEKNWIVLLYTSLYYGFILFGLILSAYCGIRYKIKSGVGFVGRLALIGFSVFMMIWECNSRYLVAYLLLLILVAVDGYFALYDNAMQVLEKKDYIGDES